MTNEHAKQLGCDCDVCPLRGRPVVGPEYATKRNPRLAIITEGPGKTEEKVGRPLVGGAGKFVNDVLESQEIGRDATHIEHVTMCRPDPETPLTDTQWKQAIQCCRPRLLKSLTEHVPRDTPVLLMGPRALTAFTGHKQLGPWRGYRLTPETPRLAWAKDNPEWVQTYTRWKILPTYSPITILRKPWYLPTLLTDINRLLWDAREFQWPERVIHEGPRMREILQEWVDEEVSYLGVDIEGSGIDPFTAFIRCIGLSDGDRSVSVPWPCHDQEIALLVRELLRSPATTIVMHNGNFDMIAFEAQGIEVNAFSFDTIVAHHIVAPQVAHDLGFVVSMEENAPRWKAQFKVNDDRKGAEFWDRVDPQDLRLYNCGDALFTARLYPALKKRLAVTHNGERNFEQSMAINHLNRKMSQVGVLVDPDRRAAHREKLTQEVNSTYTLLCEHVGSETTLDMEEEEFKPASTAQLRHLFFEEYGCKPRYRTPGGEWACNAVTLEEIQQDPSEPEEAKKAAALILEWRGWKKLLSTYVEGLPVSGDGRVHPNWKKRTLTDRHNSSDPNMQNIPAGPPKTKMGMRDMFVAPPGLTFVSADYGQLEARIQALRAGEESLLDKFENDPGFDYHGFFAQKLFQIPESEWDADKQPYKGYRGLTKTFNFGDNYGAQPKTIWQHIVTKAPHFTVKMVEDIKEMKAQQFPAIAAMKQRDLDMAYNLGYVEFPFGGDRFYFYMGQVSPTQVANLPIQGGAARIINPAMLRVAARLDWDRGEAIVMQIHDELVLQGPDPDRLLQILKEEMPQRLSIGDYSCDFPISADVGDRWSEMKEVGTYYARE